MKPYLEREEVERMEAAAAHLRDRLLVRVLFRLGCRVSEAVSLEAQDIDFASGTVRIIHLKTRVRVICPVCGGRLARSHTFCPACGGKVEGVTREEQTRRKQRILPLDEDTLALLSEYVERRGPVEREGKRLLFGINRHRAWQVVRECAQRASLGPLVNPETGKTRGVSPHRLRDSFAVNAMRHDDSGVGLRLLQEHLGHQSFNTTARYRKVSGQEHRLWYDSLWPEMDNGREGAWGSGRDLPGADQR
ncbi:MAG: tyrosine-type recombinase/integrase [Chloroflexota bacterium]|nr:tyrosine-type recombinase/integrase [Chloroflexota bacterium]